MSTPSAFLQNLIGRPVVVKLNSGLTSFQLLSFQIETPTFLIIWQESITEVF